MGNLPQDLSGQELLDVIVRDFEGWIILDTTYNIGDWPVDVIGMTFAGADERNLYFQAPHSSTYFVAIPLDSGEPVIVWSGNT